MARRIRNGEHPFGFTLIEHPGFALFEDSGGRLCTIRRVRAEGGYGRKRRNAAWGDSEGTLCCIQ